MLFGFIISGDASLEPPEFSEDTESDDNLNGTCFLQGGKQHCRGCYWEGVCDWQDSYEYESEW